MSDEIQINIEAMETDEILERVKRNYFSSEAEVIAFDVLNARKVDTTKFKLECLEASKIIENDKKEWYQNQWVSIIGIIIAMKLLGPLETIIGFVVYYLLKNKHGGKVAFWIAFSVALLATIFFGMYINSMGLH